MNQPPTSEEIESLIRRNETIRDKWRGHASFVRTLDIELQALRLLLIVIRITEEQDIEHPRCKPWHGRSFRWMDPR